MASERDDGTVVGWRLADDDDWASAIHQPRAGRWHHAGDHILYGSRSPELAVLEGLAHHRPGRGGPYWLCCILGASTTTPRRIALEELPRDWRKRKPITRAIGRRW